MPPTDSCVLGAENRIRIDHAEEDISGLKTDVCKKLDKFDGAITALHEKINKFAQKPGWAVLIIIVILSNICVGFIVNHFTKTKPQSPPVIIEQKQAHENLDNEKHVY